MKNVEDIYPLSPMQQGMLFHTLLDPEAGDYLTQLTGTIEGREKLAAFRDAWRDVIRRHTILRTAFVWETLEEPLQVVHRDADLPYSQYDWRGRSDIAGDFERFLAEDRAAGFDLATPPLMRLTIFEVAGQIYRFVWTHHHLLLDGWSLPLVLKELFEFAEAARNGQKTSFPMPRAYRDYIGWLAGQDDRAAEAYWRKALAGFTAPTPIGATAPPNGVRTQTRSHAEVLRTLDPASSTALSDLARQHRLTLNTIVQGAWALLLHHYSGERDLVFGATVSGRPADLRGVESMVGLFINTQPVRVTLRDDMPVLPWLESLQAEQIRARQFEHAPLTSIHGWSDVPRSMPLFESLVVFENYPASSMGPSIETMGVRDIGVVETTNYPLALIAAPGRELELELNYDRSRFEPDTVARMAELLTVLLQGIAADPARRLSELPLMREAERRTLLHDWNQTATPFPHDRCLHDLFAEQAQRTPDAVAVSFGNQRLTYAELDRHANRIARALQRLGVGPEVLVAIALDRSLEMIVAILGVTKAGGAWLPLAVDQPAERIAFLLEDAAPQVLVTNSQWRAHLPETARRCTVLDLDDAALEHESDTAPASPVTPDNLAYVIYTSGSTGRPKGVLLPHCGAVNMACALATVFDVRAGTRVLQFAAPTFDAAVQEIFTTLLQGGSLLLADRNRLLGPELAATLRDGQVEVVTIPPSALASMPECDLPALRTLVVAGEACPAELARRWSAGRRFVNGYGPTEGTVCATTGECDGRGPVTIGRPIDNVRVYIVDAQMRPAPVGVPGELLIGGVGVARGYLHRPELTAERFLPDPFVSEEGARVYRSGDRARYLADGRIEYIGRIDRQVKIRGFRIEPGEIEAALLAQTGVREAVIVDREDTPGDRRLVAYISPRTGELLSTRELRKALQAKLPGYMVPSAFVVLDELPLTAHGKINRNLLPPPAAARLELEKSHTPPRTALEQVLVNIWQQVLGVERIGIQENFFDLGGHSLLAMQLASRIREELGIDLPIAAVFGNPTVAQLGDRLRQDPANRAVLEQAAELILNTASLSDDELEALVAAEVAA